MLDEIRYVPLLRWKGAEKDAVRTLSPQVKNKITPFFEFVPKDFTSKSPLSTARELAGSWGWHHLCMVDFNLLSNPIIPDSIKEFSKSAAYYKLRVALTTGLFRQKFYNDAIFSALKGRDFELCLRIQSFDFRQADLKGAVLSFLTKFNLEPEFVHLVIDFQVIDEFTPRVAEWVTRIPHIDRWKSITTLLGAFPQDLTHLEKNTQQVIPRFDWINWRDFAESSNGRIPWFGDYTVQHGQFEEREGKYLNFSASIRYSSNDFWVIMRGEGVFSDNGPGFKQWPANALLLRERDEFCGENYSRGDAFMKEMSLQIIKTGTAQQWLEAALNHHMTLTANQVSVLASKVDRKAIART